MSEAHMNRKEAAALLGITDHRLWNLEMRGVVPAPRKERGRMLYSQEHVESIRDLIPAQNRPPRSSSLTPLDILFERMTKAARNATIADLERVKTDPVMRDLLVSTVAGLRKFARYCDITLEQSHE